jgi:hypothetical protein
MADDVLFRFLSPWGKSFKLLVEWDLRQRAGAGRGCHVTCLSEKALPFLQNCLLLAEQMGVKYIIRRITTFLMCWNENCFDGNVGMAPVGVCVRVPFVTHRGEKC